MIPPAALVRLVVTAFKRRDVARQAVGALVDVLSAASAPEPDPEQTALTDQAADLVTRAGELEDLAAALQARAASGSAGCVAARRQLSDVRHAILRRDLALCGPGRTTA